MWLMGYIQNPSIQLKTWILRTDTYPSTSNDTRLSYENESYENGSYENRSYND